MAQPDTTLESQRLYTLKEFEELDLPSDDNKYELIDGVLKVKPPSGFQHGKIRAKLFKHIVLFDPDEKLGLILLSTGFKLTPGFAPYPDATFIRVENVPPVTEGLVPVPPDLAVEV